MMADNDESNQYTWRSDHWYWQPRLNKPRKSSKAPQGAAYAAPSNPKPVDQKERDIFGDPANKQVPLWREDSERRVKSIGEIPEDVLPTNSGLRRQLTREAMTQDVYAYSTTQSGMAHKRWIVKRKGQNHPVWRGQLWSYTDVPQEWFK